MRWYVRNGSQRTVLVLPHLRVVLKVPRIRWRNLRDFWQGDVVGMYREMYASNHPDSRKLYWEVVWLGSKRTIRQVFGGIADNWNEWEYCLYCPWPCRQLLQPTYISLFGLLNVQKLGTPAGDFALCEALCRVISPDAPRDGHHWEKSANFDISSGSLKVLDYGSIQTQKIIEKHQEALLVFRYEKT